MCDGALGGHEDLWLTSIPSDKGPEGNLKMWSDAEDYLELLMDRADRERSEGIDVALCDAYNRCIEERRRAEDLLKLHARWRDRPIGGVVEPEPVIAPKPTG